MRLYDCIERNKLRFGTYEVDVMLKNLELTLERMASECPLYLNPAFQRGHVWSMSQREKYLEFFFTHPVVPKTIYFNNPAWSNTFHDCEGYYCLDGLQRLTTFRMFLNNEVKVFGRYLNEYEDKDIILRGFNIKLNINDLPTMEQMVLWYLNINSGGTPHTKKELDRVKSILDSLHSGTLCEEQLSFINNHKQ